MIKRIPNIHYKSFDHYDMGHIKFTQINLVYGLNGMGKSSFKHFLEEQIQNQTNNMDGIECSQEAYKVFSYDENYKRNTLYVNDDDRKNGFGSFYLGDKIDEIIKAKKKIEQAIKKAEENKQNQEKLLATAQKQEDSLKQGIAKETRNVLEKIDPHSYKTPQSYTKTMINDSGFDHAELLPDDELLTMRSRTIDEVPSIITLFDLGSTKKLSVGIATFKNMLKQTPKNEAIEKFKQDNELENFAKMAMSIREKNPSKYNEKCPLCEQEIIAIKLWDNLKKHFNQEYQAFVDRLNKAKGFFERALQELSDFTNWLNKNFINKIVLCDRGKIDIDRLRQDYLESINFIQASIKTTCDTLEEKIKAPNKGDISLSINDELFKKHLQKVISDELQQIADSHNKKQAQYKTLVRDNIEKIKRHFVAKQKENFYAIQKEIKKNKRCIQKYGFYISCCKQKIKELDDKLKESDVSIQNLNDDLCKHFGFKEIKFEKLSDSHYQTERQDCKGNWFACKSGLSEGEKTIISMIYFVNYYLAFLKQQGNACPIVIFDDPITSLDDNNRDSIKNYIVQKIILQNRGQIFVLSHDKNLLAKIHKDLKSNLERVSIFNIKKTGGLRSKFQTLDSRKLESKKELREIYGRLKEEFNTDEIQSVDDIRKLLEGLMAIIFEDASNFSNSYQKLLQYLNIEQRYTSSDIQELNHNKTDIEPTPELLNKAKFVIEIFDKAMEKIKQ